MLPSYVHPQRVLRGVGTETLGTGIGNPDAMVGLDVGEEIRLERRRVLALHATPPRAFCQPLHLTFYHLIVTYWCYIVRRSGKQFEGDAYNCFHSL